MPNTLDITQPGAAPMQILSALPFPNLSSRPFSASAERHMSASPKVLHKAWTEQFDKWFAVPGTVRMSPHVDAPFFFETHYEGEDQPHYGRFLKIVADRLVQLTWLNAGGTAGAETVVSVSFEEEGTGTRLRLSHSGFSTEELAKRHFEAWPHVLKQLDKAYPANHNEV
jgi:uncharacterized protein YndB with AHSA1/START domain